MSSAEAMNESNLAREEEKAALARAKAELDAEREAMRAELEAIEEEERLEEERLAREAQAAKQTKQTKQEANNAPSKPSDNGSKTTKTHRQQSGDVQGEPKSIRSNDDEAEAGRGANVSDPKVEKDKENRTKSSRSSSEDVSEGTEGTKTKKKTERTVSTEDATGGGSKGEKKDKKDRKGASSANTGSPDAEEGDGEAKVGKLKDSSDKPKKDKKDDRREDNVWPSGLASSLQASLSTAGEYKKTPTKEKTKKEKTPSTPSSNDALGTEKDKEKKDKKDKSERGDRGEKIEKTEKTEKTSKSEGISRVESGENVSSSPSSSSTSNTTSTPKSPGKKRKDRSITAPTTPKSKSRDRGRASLSTSDDKHSTGTGSPVSGHQSALSDSGLPKLNRVESAIKIPVLDLSNRKLTVLPEDIAQCTYLTKLYLARNSLENLDALSSLSDLQVLSCANNSVKQFPVSLSSSNSKLKDLVLADNLMTNIPVPALSFPFLLKLDLMANQFAEFPSAVLSITTLTSLNLAWNSITEVPKAISALTQLTSLSLHHNQIKRIASGICQLSKLATLELNDNQLNSIPESIAELASITVLDVSHNQLKEWPLAFNKDCQLASLTRLDLSHNLISGSPPPDRFADTSVDESIFPSIEELYLNNNAITALPTEFWKNIANIAVLDLRNNQLTELSEELGSFYSLSTLEVGANKLTALPAGIGNLTNLQVLSFYRNAITQIPDLSALEYLQYLNAGHNLITDITFEGLKSLEEMFISGNPIKQLPDEIGEMCPNLKLLFASDMALKKVPSGLNALRLLEQIDFSHNRISEIPPSLGDLEALKTMSFAHCKLETSKERETLKTPGKGPWDCIEFWQNFAHLLEVDLSFNKLKYVPKGLETKLGTPECDVNLIGNPLVLEDSLKERVFVAPQLGKRFQVGWAEMLGRRPTMEDHFLWQGALDGNSHVDLFAVFDGHAAREAASFCAAQMPNIVKRALLSIDPSTGAMPAAPKNDSKNGSSDSKNGGSDPKNGGSDPKNGGSDSKNGGSDSKNGSSDAIFGDIKPDAKMPKQLATKSDTMFTRIFSAVNAALEKHLASLRDNSVKHCGTTAVVVLIVGDTMQIANVGDARAVLNTGERCTVDHKPRSEVARIRSHPGGYVTGGGSGRINEVLAVSRCLGDFYMVPWVTCEPHVFNKTLSKAEDKYLILACDGIWDEIEDADAISIVDPLIADGELFKAASKLRDIAYCAGSDDNISVMIIKLSSK